MANRGLPPTSSLSETDVLILLTERQCRQTLRVLRESASPLPAIELAKRIANREYENPSAEELRTTHLDLHNNYLPQLGEANVVEYDVNEGTVRPGLNFDVFVSFIQKADEKDLPWSDE